MLAVLAAAGFVTASDAAVACVNRVAAWAFGATTLPGLHLEHGVPGIPPAPWSPFRPLLTSASAIANQVARLEIHFLSSGDSEIPFRPADGTGPTAQANIAPTTAVLLNAAVAGIARLNQVHGPAPGGARFLLLHRRRVWNAGEARWIGWERKRGKTA